MCKKILHIVRGEMAFLAAFQVNISIFFHISSICETRCTIFAWEYANMSPNNMQASLACHIFFTTDCECKNCLLPYSCDAVSLDLTCT